MPRPPAKSPNPKVPGPQELLEHLRPSRDMQAEADGEVRSRSTRRLTLVGGGIALGFVALLLQAGGLMLRPDAQLWWRVANASMLVLASSGWVLADLGLTDE